MSVNSAAIFRWAARLLSLLFALFLGAFALDALEGGGWEAVAGFLIHLLPSFFLLAATALAWRFELIGAGVYAAFIGWYLLSAGFDRHWSWYAVICGPAALIAILYILGFLLDRGKGPDARQAN